MYSTSLSTSTSVVLITNLPTFLYNSFFNLKKKFFWLRWVFIAARGLSLVAASGGFSCGARALGVRASVVAARGLQELWLPGSRAQAQ